MNYVYILTPMTGALIGYFTNVIAIYMLFRPHEKKKLFGINVPFTPGVIGKEKGRLATKIGETVSNHLVTNESVIELLLEKDFTPEIETQFNKISDYIKNTDKTLEELILEFKISNADILIEDLNNYFAQYLTEKINDPLVINFFVDFFSVKILEIIKEDKFNEKTKDIIVSQIDIFLNSVDKYYLDLLKEDKTIKDVFNHETLKKLHTLLIEETPKLAIILAKFFEDEENYINKELFLIFDKAINANFGKMIGSLINTSKTYNTLRLNTIEYLTNESVDIQFKVSNFYKMIINYQISQVLSNVPEETGLKTITAVKQFVKNIIKTELNKNQNINDYIYKLYPDFGIRLRELLYKSFNYFIKNNSESLINNISENVSNKILKFKVKNMYKLIYKLNNKSVYEKINLILKSFIQNNSDKLLESINIKNLVEDKINNFSIEKLEEIVLSVTKKELKLITYVGGVLGFIIGMIPVLIDVFSR